MLIPPGEGKALSLGGFGVILKLVSDQTGGGFALVEHTIEPRSLGALVHTHQHEDEYSYVLEGEIGAEVGDEVVRVAKGALLVKPRGIPHAFWNGTDAPARLLEMISPGGFERYFEEIAPLLAGDSPPNVARLAEIAGRFGLAFDIASVPRLAAEHGLNVPGM